VGFNSCDTPQELTDQEIDQALAPQVGGIELCIQNCFCSHITAWGARAFLPSGQALRKLGFNLQLIGLMGATPSLQWFQNTI